MRHFIGVAMAAGLAVMIMLGSEVRAEETPQQKEAAKMFIRELTSPRSANYEGGLELLIRYEVDVIPLHIRPRRFRGGLEPHPV